MKSQIEEGIEQMTFNLEEEIFERLTKPKQKTTNHMQLVLDYILEHEEEDFRDNPSDSHVYFHAYAVEGGIDAAKHFLNNLINKENPPCDK